MSASQRLATVVGVVAFAAACLDFDAAQQQCHDAGRCEATGGTGALGGGGAANGGGGNASLGGGTVSVGGGAASAGGGMGPVGGGTTAAGGGTTALGGGTTAAGGGAATGGGPSGLITGLEAGLDHSCALRDHTVWCWGANDAGQLGAGSALAAPNPRAVLNDVSRIGAGSRFSCALRTDGGVDCWGVNDRLQLGSVSGVGFYRVPIGAATSIAVGAAHVCVLTQAELICWGDSSYGQAGVPPSASPTEPFSVALLSGQGFPFALVAGSQTTALVFRDGGLDLLGNLLIAANSTVPSRRYLRSGQDIIFSAGAIGEGHACFAHQSGTAKLLECWGDNGDGQVGSHGAPSFGEDAPLEPFSLAVSQSVRAVAASAHNSYAVFFGSAVYAFGASDAGQLGGPRFSVTPQPVPGLWDAGPFLGAGSEGSHACALADGDAGYGVYCWGLNTSGQATGVVGQSIAPPTRVRF